VRPSPKPAPIALLLGLAACASLPSSRPDPAPRAGASETLGLEGLERLEFERPQDPGVKLRLARSHACREDWGLAVEHALWIRQFAPTSSEREAAERLLEQAVDAKRQAALRAELACP